MTLYFGIFNNYNIVSTLGVTWKEERGREGEERGGVYTNGWGLSRFPNSFNCLIDLFVSFPPNDLGSRIPVHASWEGTAKTGFMC